MKRFLIHFLGHVQGVGFRYAAKQVSKNFDVRGTVENLPDGRVRMLVEATRTEMDGFVQQVVESSQTSVLNVEIEILDESDPPELIGFEIVR